jgi:hypothetical protein
MRIEEIIIIAEAAKWNSQGTEGITYYPTR